MLAKKYCRVAFVVCMNLAAGSSLAAAEAPARDLQQLDARLAAAFRNGHIPGGAAAVIERGQVVFTRGYGFSDIARKIPVTPETNFRAGSVSKSFTSIGIMALVQQGKLSLDAHLADMAPEVKFTNPWEKTDPVRLSNLLEHTTGWPDVAIRLYAVDGRGWSLKRAVLEASPHFYSRWRPGTFAVYNNAGPTVAGYVLEKVSGQDFDSYMREHVLRPMGMATADFDLSPELLANLAKSYGPAGNETPYQYPILRPAASLTSNVRELAQIVRLFLGRGTIDGHEVLTPQSVARIEHSETSLASRSGLTNGYGLGNTALMDHGVTFRGHNGGIDSFTSVYGYSLRDGSGYVLLANGGDGVDFGTPMSEAIENYLTRSQPPRLPPAIPIDDQTLAQYAGFYRSVAAPSNFLRLFVEVLGGLTHVTAEHGKLVVGGDIFVPVGKHLFRRQDRDQANIAFVEDSGKMYKLGFLSAQEKEPIWWVVLFFVIGAFIAIGVLASVLMIFVWSVAAIRRRLSTRGLFLPAWPLASIAALLTTIGLPFLSIVMLGPGPAVVALAEVNVYTAGTFVCSLLFPLLAIAGLVFSVRSFEAGRLVRVYTGAVSIALLVISVYALSIGWVGIRTWAI